MDVEVYQYLMSRSGVGSTGAGFFLKKYLLNIYSNAKDARKLRRTLRTAGVGWVNDKTYQKVQKTRD